jgi:hypothetical protein
MKKLEVATNGSFRERELVALHVLSREVPNIDAAVAQIARYAAELTLPQGTIHVLSDIHGEDQKLRHVINNASGTLRPLVERLFKEHLTPEHGSSSVREEEVRRINAAGGKLDPSARGVDEDEYLPAAKLGVTKINIETDGRLVWTRVRREFFRDHSEQFDFRPSGKTFVAEYAKFIAHKKAKAGFGSAIDRSQKGISRKVRLNPNSELKTRPRARGRPRELWVSYRDTGRTK